MFDPGAAVQRLAKWRSVFAAWQLGTRLDTDEVLKAVKDHREVTIMLRAEVSTLTGLLIEKGMFSAEEFTEALGKEAEMLNADFERRFPGIKATDTGITYDLAVARETMKGWPG